MVYTALMRLAVAVVLFSSLLCACGDGGDEDTGGDDTSSTMPPTTAPTDSSPADSDATGPTDSATGSTLECDANVEFALADGVELGAQSVDAVRLEIGEDVQYTVTIVGDAEGATQLDIVYPGLPVQGMAYAGSPVMQFAAAQVTLVPGMPLDFLSGTVTYTTVGTAEGDTLALDFQLEFTAGTIEGCVQTELAIEAG